MKDMILVEIRSNRSSRNTWFLNIYSDESMVCAFCDEKLSKDCVTCEFCKKVK
jgi:hypothetical protein